MLAASLVDLLREPAVVKAAQSEFAKATGGRPYQSPLSADARPTDY